MQRTFCFVLSLALASPAAALAQSQRPAGRASTRARDRHGAASTATPAPATATSSAVDASEPEPPSEPPAATDDVIAAIQAAAVASNAEGARSIAHLLLRGVPPRAAAAGLDALGVLARPEGAPAVLRFLAHRRGSLRRHAIAAAQAIHTPALVRALAARLGDGEEDVRDDAATALGEVGNHDVVPALLAAFEHELDSSLDAQGSRLLHECGKAVARVGRPDDITRLLGFLRRAPFRTMSESMRVVLTRADVPEAFKLRVVSTIGDLATHDVREFLDGVIADAHGQDNAVVRAARAAADRIAE